MKIYLGDTVLYKGSFKTIEGIEESDTGNITYLIEADGRELIEIPESDIIRLISLDDEVQLSDPDDLTTYTVESIHYDTGKCIISRLVNISDIIPHTGLGN